jgi:thiol-disulfide isomerase/thioredoxin
MFAALALAACQAQPAVTADQVTERYEAGTQAYERDIARFQQTAARDTAFTGDLTDLADFLRAAMRQRADADARQLAAVYLTTLQDYRTPLRPGDHAEIIEAAPPMSPHWVNAQWGLRYVVLGLPEDEARSFLNALADRNPSRVVQGQALITLAQLERRTGNMRAFERTYRRLEPYREEPDLRFAIRVLNPENTVVVGGAAPSFALREVGTNRLVTSNELRGRYYLLDFWATWCGPCITERPAITRAQERFGGDRFTVVSVSLDNSVDQVVRFRERRWSMPWLQLYAPGSEHSEDSMRFDGEIARAYEISWIGLPQLVLVSPEGQVLALRDQLEGPLLEETLERYVGEPSRD